MTKYAYCETISAYVWHIRPLTKAGLKLGGGADTPALCGAKVLWDIQCSVDPIAPAWDTVCPICQKRYLSVGLEEMA
jgi:hypothetical protein